MNRRTLLTSACLCAAALTVVGCGSKSSKRSAVGGATAATTSSTSGSVGNANAPALTQVAPQSGSLDGGTSVTITGSGFTAQGAGETLVLFGSSGVRATPVSDTEIVVTSPLALTAGIEDVRVVNENGNALLRGAWTYTPRPASLTYEPVVGHHELGQSGTEITLRVEGIAPLTSAAQVTFGNVAVPAQDITLVDSKTLTAKVPQSVTPGPVDIVVDEQGQTATAPGFLIQDQLAYGDLLVNEFCPHPGGIDSNQDGFGDSKADEFVEIINTTNRPIDLSYLTLYDSHSERHRFPNPTTLPPGGALTVFGGGTSHRFTAQHTSGQAQQATTGELALNNSADGVEIRTLPGLNPVGTTIFKVDYTNPPTGSSYVNRNDGQAILTNPATSADYVDHLTIPGAPNGFSPSHRVDGTDF